MSIQINEKLEPDMGARGSQRMHLEWLDQIRGGAALYVLCHHAVMQIQIEGDHAHDTFYRMIQLATSFGHYAVDVFIILSGYCLMLPIVARQNFGDVRVFYLRRTVRILLPYYASIAVTLLLIAPWLEGSASAWARHSLPVTFDSLWKHSLLIHQWFTEDALKINGALWSVGVEYQIYFLFPMFYLLTRKIGFLSSAAIVTSASYGLWGVCLYFNVLNPGPNGTSLYYCALFFMGMAAADLANRSPERLRARGLAWIDLHASKAALMAIAGILATAMISFLIARFFPSLFFPLQIQSLVIGFFTALLLCVKGRTSTSQSLFPYRINLSWLGWVGTMGFSVYLLHDPVIALVWTHLVLPLKLQFYWMQAIAELIIGMTVTLMLASIFYKWVELPSHRLSKVIAQR